MTDQVSLTTSHAIGDSTPPVRDLTIGDLLREAAAAAPDQLALIEGIPLADGVVRRQWTYAELLAHSERTARALLHRFEPGSHIAIWAHNIPEWELLEFGCALAGMVIVTVNPAFQQHELQYVLTQSRAKAVFVVPSHRGNAMLATAQGVQAECPELHDIISFDNWEDFLTGADQFTGDLPQVAPTDPVMLQYTSGTTGFPKGALLHHRGLVNNGHHVVDRLGVADGDVYVQTMPLFHTGGSALGVLGCVSKHLTQVLVREFEPGLVIELSQTYESNTMLGVPTMLVAILEHPDFASADLSSLKALCSGGSLVPEHLVRTFEEKLGAPFTIVFGQTECSPVASMTRPTDTIGDKAGTIGPPMPNVEVRIVDPESGETLPIGEVGEYLTRGYHVMCEYFEMPEATAETIDADGWLHTGDLAAMDDRGYCTVEGRLKDMIIRGGENIYPKELEELLFAHEAVGEVAVVGLPDDNWGETVGAFVRPTPGTTVDKQQLFNYLRENLAPHKTPRQWFAVDEFPFTGSGKIQKFKLRQQWIDGEWNEL
ncbi:AMP-binding protein [Ilumatobacter sp.]|uniref:AMP-binding protein n=1 Tax=Ilumatobacter sp. TaxID=1967498 RepID=UPI0030AC0545